jgi:hypothetical protein
MDQINLRPRKSRMVALYGIGLAAIGAAALLSIGADAPPATPDTGAKEWHVHDRTRPQPAVVTPGVASTQDQVGTPPSDAVVLFDGKDLSQWESDKGGPNPWTLEDGAMMVSKGGIHSKETFGDCQLHAEWMSPNPPRGKDQDRGNSGIFIMSRYELQVLDNYQAETYADGMAGSIYGQYPPQVNASRQPGQWQTYDVIFHAPRFNEDGTVAKPARETVFFNGVLVQDNVELKGATAHMTLAKYTKHADKMPIALQDHGHPVKYRNFWVRPIAAENPVTPTLPGVPH